MKNQPCYDKEGNTLGWMSRSTAVLMLTFAPDLEGNLCVLASKRGSGTPDPEFIGCWNAICGYLDYNETTMQAAIRETYEETGVKVDEAFIYDWKWVDDYTSDKRQNVIHRFIALIPNLTNNFSLANAEPNEVEEVKWIPVKDILKYEWAFNHDSIIVEAILYLLETALMHE